MTGRGAVSGGGACSEWQGRLAMWAIGQLDPAEVAEVDAHLAECPACREEARELGEVVALLPLVDVGSVAEGPRATLGQLEQRSDHPVSGAADRGSVPNGWFGQDGDQRHGSREGTARRSAVAIGALVAAVAIAASAFAVSSAPVASPAAKSVILTGQPGVQATVALTPVGHGSRALLTASGQPPGSSYSVSMESKNGYQWVAGSYRTGPTAGTVRVALDCPVRPGLISEIWVSGPTGRTVLSGYA